MTIFPVKHAFCAVKTLGFRNCRPSRCEPHKREFYVNVAVIVAFQSQPNKNAAMLPMDILLGAVLSCLLILSNIGLVFP